MQKPYTVERRVLARYPWPRYYWSLRFEDTEIRASKDYTELHNLCDQFTAIYNLGYSAAMLDQEFNRKIT